MMEKQKLNWKESAVRHIIEELSEKENSFRYFRTGKLDKLLRSITLFTDYHLFVEFIDLCIGFNQTPRFRDLRNIALDRCNNSKEKVDVRLIKYIANEIINVAYEEFDRDPSNYRLHCDGEAYTLLYTNLEGEEIQLKSMDHLMMLTEKDNAKLKNDLENIIKTKLYDESRYIIDNRYKEKIESELNRYFKIFNTWNVRDFIFSGLFSEEDDDYMMDNAVKILFDIDAYGFKTQVRMKMTFYDHIPSDEGLCHVDVVMENIFHEAVCVSFEYDEKECEDPFGEAIGYIVDVVNGEKI